MGQKDQKDQKDLFDQKDINAIVVEFNDTKLNIFCNYIPNMYISVDDNDESDQTIKSKIKVKNIFCTKDIENARFESDFVFLENLLESFTNNWINWV